MYSNERKAVKIVAIAGLIVLLVMGFSFLVHYSASLAERHRPTQYMPLLVGFSVPLEDGTYQGATVGIENDTLAKFNLPANSYTQFTYAIVCKTAEPQHNVTLRFDSVPEQLSLLALQNQTYPIPFEIQVGTVEVNIPQKFAAILETPAQEGVYEMQWTITSEETAYSFTIRVNVYP